MTKTLIAGARLFPATDEDAFVADLLVEGNSIAAVSRAPGSIDAGDAQVIDGSGMFLMPGMTEGHGHMSFDNITATEGLMIPPPEEQTLATARNAKLLFDHGFTSVYSASEAKLRLAVAVRNEVEAGRLVGPRIRAAGVEISVTGAMGDEGKLHDPRLGPSMLIDGPEEMRKAVRLQCREGVDNIKLDVSGDPFYPGTPGDCTPMAYEEVEMACRTAHAYGKMVNAHSRSIEGTKMCARAGVDMFYHLEYSDEEMLDMLEAQKDRIFVTPTFGLLYTMLHEASDWGITPEVAHSLRIDELVDCAAETHSALRKRGIRHLIGGDYGIAWNPQGTNARDVKHFVDFFGYSPAGALVCATRNGGLAMKADGSLGTLTQGALADMLLVDGDPLADPSILTDADRLVLIMKDGVIHKNAAGAPQERRAAA
ncbi:amidohydrolase family protein [Stakelama tenebrarum]|uniref:Amidohydrolase family protein n=1 Tax=Stakelama tenebrarum TaxID=2711215 RepID=A0A6G6Y4P4_9SPHN|nr:amidohydrolase family protein [Sphingosinithalassobacter tenebrarum]QIG79885.1 amidohydrolase family protein [Sphingosinithalassobacter tenebrarum]